MLPLAMCFGEVFTLQSTGLVGFLDRADLHTTKYLTMNLFAGKLIGSRAGSGLHFFFFFVFSASS